MGRKYRPSNGTEGECFHESYCYQCIHERWVHRQNENKDEDKCDIWNRALLHEPNEEEYPVEWTYKNGTPVCTSFEKFDWGNDDNGYNEPPPKPEPPDPNQLCMPFEIDLVNENVVEEKINSTKNVVLICSYCIVLVSLLLS